MDKLCIKCNDLLPISDFYKHSGMGDGHLNKCCRCCKEYSRERHSDLSKDMQFVLKERERSRNRKAGGKQTKEQKAASMFKYRDRFPEKYRARVAAQRMERTKKENELHHWSYNDEHLKDVIELSVKDHKTAHRFMVYDSERMMYRTTEGVLLDTKEDHLNYIKAKIQ